jgi:hypothetical protein
VADGWCWFVLREEYCWLVDGGFVREKYCWPVADKPSKHGVKISVDQEQAPKLYYNFASVTVVIIQ